MRDTYAGLAVPDSVKPLITETTYSISAADLLVELLRVGGSRVVSREELRGLWKARYPVLNGRSVQAYNKRKKRVDNYGSAASGKLTQALAALERGGVVQRLLDTDAVRVLDIAALVAAANLYRAARTQPEARDSSQVTAGSSDSD